MTHTIEIDIDAFDHGYWRDLIGLIEIQYEADEYGADPTHLIGTLKTGAGQLVYEFRAEDKDHANKVLNETIQHNFDQDEIARIA